MLLSVIPTFSLFFVNSNLQAGTVNIVANGLSSTPIFVTSDLQSIAPRTELNIGIFTNPDELTSVISIYKAGVTGVGTSDSEVQTDALNKAMQLYDNTVNWLTDPSNFISLPAFATSITQASYYEPGKIVFNDTRTRTVNGRPGTYGASTATMSLDYSWFPPNLKIWMWYATGSEIAVVTDSTWVLPSDNLAHLTLSTMALVSTGEGNSSELLLATYTDYSSGSDLISSVKVQVPVSVPEPSSLSLLALGGVVVALRRRKKE
jgi:hypothetical protein